MVNEELYTRIAWYIHSFQKLPSSAKDLKENKTGYTDEQFTEAIKDMESKEVFSRCKLKVGTPADGNFSVRIIGDKSYGDSIPIKKEETIGGVMLNEYTFEREYGFEALKPRKF